MTIRLDDKVAIVTGAGAGLGRSHALALAARGAKVLVNDLGGTRDGTGRSLTAAKQVVNEIVSAGGEAVANGADVANFAEVESMVAEVIDRWGRVDILINNAGILRDKTFAKMALEDFRAVIDVHLMGSVHCSKAVWRHMVEREYGRIVMTTSSSGLYGRFGQSNYGAAKLAVVGLMNTLAIEGHKYGIKVNSISPVAATRMTEDVIPDENMMALLSPEAASAAVLVLCGRDAPTKTILCAGGGGYSSSHIVETDGIYLDVDERTPENISAAWSEITDPATWTDLEHGGLQTQKFLTKARSS